MCPMQRHNGDGGAVDKSRGYVMKLDALSIKGSIPANNFPVDSMQTTLHSLLHCIESAKDIVFLFTMIAHM